MNDVPAGANFFIIAQYHNTCGLVCPEGYNWNGDFDGRCQKPVVTEWDGSCSNGGEGLQTRSTPFHHR